MQYAAFLLAILPVAAPQPDARALVRQSILNGERAWKESFSYYCTEREIDRPLGRGGHASDSVYQVIPLGEYTSFELPVKKNGRPVTADVRAKAEAELARRRAESPEQKHRRFLKEQSERSYMLEVPDAFDFTITGSADLPTGPAWVVTATPHPGYQPKSRYAHMFHAMQGNLWIDKKDLQWVKADAIATSSVSFGFFLARLYKGSHIVLEQTRLPDGNWVASRIEARASARTFFTTHNFNEQITYTDYHRAAASTSPPTVP